MYHNTCIRHILDAFQSHTDQLRPHNLDYNLYCFNPGVTPRNREKSSLPHAEITHGLLNTLLHHGVCMIWFKTPSWLPKSRLSILELGFHSGPQLHGPEHNNHTPPRTPFHILTITMTPQNQPHNGKLLWHEA
jgi:hypothetical protein